jgi:hypothetical protein
MKNWHVTIGAISLALGVYGIYDEYFVVVEFIKGSLQPLTALVGLICILAGLFSYQPRIKHVAFGLLLVGIGIYGFFDEYFAVLDFFKGALPPALLLVGMVSVVAGVKNLG